MSDAANTNEEDGPSRTKVTRTLGLLASPGHCERVAEDIVDELPERLRQTIDPDLTWKIEVVSDPLTGSNVAMSDILDEIVFRKSTHSWDYAICLTDLPIRRGNRIVIGQTGGGLDVAVISVPPIGIFRVRPRVSTMILELMDDLYRGTTDEDEPARFLRGQDGIRDLSTDEAADGDLRYTSPRITGHLRLLAGMVYANRPWRLFPSFKTAIATAFATGGYGLIFTSLWEIGNAYGYTRLVVLMLAAMTILATWIIASHQLWEGQQEGVTSYVRRLYNTTTLLTIVAGVMFSYAVIFIMLLVAAGIYIPTSMLESTLEQPVSFINYLKVAWVTASVATIAGAVGAGLEDSDEVRNATFGWRQSNRWQQYREQEESEDKDRVS